jgi:hypothetical protein
VPPAAQPDYFAHLRERVQSTLHRLNNQSAVTQNNCRFLFDQSLRGLTPDQLAALRDATTSSEETAALLRELQSLLA